MELILNSVQDLKSIVDVCSSIISTITIDCQTETINLTGVDPAHISLLYIQFEKTKVAKYTCPTPVTLTLYANTLHAILSTANTNDQIMLYTEEDNIEKLKIILTSSERTQTYEIPLLHEESDIIESADLDFTTIFTVSAKTFHKICCDFQKLNCENIIFENKSERESENMIVLKATSDICSTTTVLSSNGEKENSVHIIKNEGELSQEFCIKYIQIFSKLQNITNEAKICIAQHFPILLIYEFSTGNAKFYIAPKFIEE